MSAMQCPVCRVEVPEQATWCQACGANLDALSFDLVEPFHADLPEPESGDLPVVEPPPEDESVASGANERPLGAGASQPVPPSAPCRDCPPGPIESGTVELPAPQLVLDTGARSRVGANGVLWFGLVNPRDVPLTCRLLVEVEENAQGSFSYFSGERELRVDPSSESACSVSFRATDAGVFPLSVKLFVEDDRGFGLVRFYRVPSRCRVNFGVAAGLEGGTITVHNSVNVERNYGGDITIRPEALNRLRDQMGQGDKGHRAKPLELPLSPPGRVLGWQPYLPGSVHREHISLDLQRSGKLERRIHILARNEVCFGRNDRTLLPGGVEASNTLAWRWLPCRSRMEDEEFFDRNQTISRYRAGVLQAGSEGTVVAAGKSGFRFDGEQVGPGKGRSLRTGTTYNLGLGDPPLELGLTAFRRRGEDAARWLRMGRQLGGWTGITSQSTHHDAIRVERLNNLGQVCYLVLLSSASIGGGNLDTIRVEGLPRSFLRLARCGPEIYMLVLPPAGQEDASRAADHFWRPIGGPTTLAWGDFSLTFRVSCAEETKGEQDLGRGECPA